MESQALFQANILHTTYCFSTLRIDYTILDYTRYSTWLQNKNLGKSIELLPQSGSSSNSSPAPSSRESNSPGCLDEDLLLLKATSHAALYSMEEALAILQEFREEIQCVF